MYVRIQHHLKFVNLDLRTGELVQWIKLSLAMAASHIGVYQNSAQLPTQLPGNIPGKAEGGVPCAWGLSTHVGDPDGTLNSWLASGWYISLSLSILPIQ